MQWEKINKPIPGVAESVDVSPDKRNIHSICVIQNGQTGLLLQQKTLSSLGNVP